MPRISVTRRLTLEHLEARCVPASHLNAFARFTEAALPGSSTLTIQIRTTDFILPVGGVRLGLALRADDGTTNPTPVRVQPLGTTVARVLGSRSDMPNDPGSLTFLQSGAGSVRLTVPTDLVASRGSLEVFLLGDANRDFRVNQADLTLLQTLQGKQFGQTGYRLEADVNGDGLISLADSNLARTNLGAATSLRCMTAVAGLSPQSDPDANRIVLKSAVTFTGQTRPGNLVQLDIGANGTIERQVRAAADGRFSFPTTLPAGRSAVRMVINDGFGQRMTLTQEITVGDVVLDWNAVHLTALRDYTTLVQVPYPNRIVHTLPPLAARNLAMVHTAMFDAINAVDHRFRPYSVDVTATPGTSAPAAAAAAAHRVLSALYPKAEQLALFNAAMAESLASVPDGPAETAGIALGHTIADAILALRSNDGASAVATFTPGSDPGDWILTPPDFLPPVLPQWPGVTPFSIPSGDAFLPQGPPALTSAEYAADYNEVKELGRYDSTTRTAEQTEIALFWSDGPGTLTPPGHWNQIACTVAAARGNTLAENARLFAMLNIALADAGISCWDTKYEYAFWRPITAILQGDQDGNDQTSADTAWLPLLKTPAFPTYTSGHSTFSAAAAAVLAGLYGDNVTFTDRSDAQDGLTQRPLNGGSVTRTFTSFSQAAHEASRSRVYGGIHFGFDCTVGLEMGRLIGEFVLANELAALA